MNGSNEFVLDLLALLEMKKSKSQINANIKELEQAVRKIRLVATLAKGNTKSELNQMIKQIEAQLRQIKLQAKIDSRQLNREISNALRNVSARDIQLNFSSNGEKVNAQVRRVVSQAREFVSRNPISINIDLKKEKLLNQLAVFTNKHTKINESSYWLGEAERIRSVIEAVSNRDELRDATDQFQVFTTGVRATGYAAVSTTDRIKGMLGNIVKIGNYFGLAFVAVNKFRQSLDTLKSNDTILTEISKTSEMTKQQLKELGDEAFKVASKYGQVSGNYLTAVQEMARSGYEMMSKQLGELSLLAQSAGDMSAEMANNYLLATDAAYKYGGSVEKLNAALDGANYISNKNSASLTDIADATRVSASFAANAGVEIAELTAAEATMIAATKRSGSEIGRAFRSIILNLQQVSGEFDGEEINEEQLKKVEERCHSLGVELEYMKDGMATLRNPMEILKELAETYNSLPDNSAEKQGLISDIGGKYHANSLSALLSRWDMYEKMLGEFSQGTGSALEEANKTADSWEGRLAQLQNSWDSFVNSLTSKGAIKGGISFLDNTIQTFEKLTDTLGAIPVLLTTINGSMSALNKNYGITQIYNKDSHKFDLQGNFMGVDITAYKTQVKHFQEASVAIGDWNNQLVDGVANIDDFGSAVVQNNEQLKAYLLTTSTEAPASLAGYRAYLNAAGVSTDALRLKTILMTSAFTMGASLLVSIGISAMTSFIDKIIVTKEEIKEAANDARTAINNIKSDFDNLSSTTDDIKQRFAELAQGVENLGKVNQSRGKLSTEDYEEFLGLSNQIAELFPQLTRGYDDNGNAILGLSGNVNTIVGSLNDLILTQQKLANQQILEKMPDIWNGYTAELDEYNKELGVSKEQVDAYQTALNKMSSGDGRTLTTDSYFEQHAIINAARKIGLDDGKWYQNKLAEMSNETYENGEFQYAEWDFSSLTDAQIEQLKNELGALGSEYEDSVQQAKNKIESANSEMSSYINTWLSGEWNFSKMDSGMQNVVKDALLSTDWLSQLPDDIDANNWEEVSNWLQNEFLYAINAIDNEKIQTALVDAFDGEFTVESLQGIIDQLLTTEGFDQNNPLIIYLQTKLDNRQEKEDSVRNGMDASDSTATDWINSLNEEELALADSDEFEQAIDAQKEKLNGAALAAEDYENALNGIKDKQDEHVESRSFSEALSQPADEGDDTYADIINAYEQKRASLQSYLDKIANNTFESSDKLSLATEFGITGNSVDELRTRIENLMELNLDSIIKKIDQLLNDGTLNGQAVTDLRNLKQSIIDISTEAKKASPIKIDTEVSSLSDIQSLSTGLKQLGDIYNDVKDGKEFDWSSILNNESFTKEFGNLGDVYNDFIKQISDAPDDIKKCQDAFNDLATAYIYAAKDINGNSIMGNLTEETKDATIAMLEQMGVENAEEVVKHALAYATEVQAATEEFLAQKKRETGDATYSLINATAEEIKAFAEEKGYADSVTNALLELALKKQLVNGTTLDFSGDLTNISNYVKALGGAANAIGLLNRIKNGEVYMPGDAMPSVIASAQAEVDAALAGGTKTNIQSGPNINFKGAPSGGTTKNKGGGSSAKKEPQEIDWTANSIENLISVIDKLNAKLEKSKSYKTQLKYLKQIRKETENLAKAYQKQADTYKAYWEKTSKKLSDKQKKAVMSGKKFSIKEYGEETYNKLTEAQDAWKQYQEAKIKVIETQQEAIEAQIAEYQRRVDRQQSRVDKLSAQYDVTTSTKKKNEIENKRLNALKEQYKYEIKIAKAEGDIIKARQLELELEAEIIASKKTKFDNIVTQYENKAGKKNRHLDDIDNRISLIEARGSYVNGKYYDKQYADQKALAKMYDEEEKKLRKRLESIKKYTEEWYEALEAIQDVQNKANDARIAMQEAADKMNDLASSLDNLITNKFSTLINEAGTLKELLGDKLVDDDLGDFTENGIAALGLIYSQMQAENQKGDQMRKQLAILEEQMESYKDGKTVTFIDANGMKRTISSMKELKDLEEETRKNVQESAKSEYSYYKNIIDLMKERYEAEKNYLDDLIAKKKELLDTEQDLHQYAKDIKEQTDSIASLQKQLAALSGDNSLEGQARRQKIEAQLQESKDTLAETEYDRLIFDQKDMLDNLSSEYAQMMESYMKNDDALFREGIEVIKQNASLISDVTTSVADKWGMELSGEMESVVGNINSVDFTLNGIRSDLQEYFASTQEDKNKEDAPVHSNGSRLPLDTKLAGEILKDRDHIESRHDNDTVDSKKPNVFENEGTKLMGSEAINTSTGKVIGEKNFGSVETKKMIDPSASPSSLGQNDEVIRVDLGDGKIRNLVRVEPPKEFVKLGERLMESPINYPTPNLDNLAKQLAESAPTRVENNNNTHIENVTFSLPNVQNYRDLVKEAQKDKKFETMINHMVRTQLTGGNRLEKFKVMF